MSRVLAHLSIFRRQLYLMQCMGLSVIRLIWENCDTFDLWMCIAHNLLPPSGNAMSYGPGKLCHPHRQCLLCWYIISIANICCITAIYICKNSTMVLSYCLIYLRILLIIDGSISRLYAYLQTTHIIMRICYGSYDYQAIYYVSSFWMLWTIHHWW